MNLEGTLRVVSYVLFGNHLDRGKEKERKKEEEGAIENTRDNKEFHVFAKLPSIGDIVSPRSLLILLSFGISFRTDMMVFASWQLHYLRHQSEILLPLHHREG